jgi:hypothetical protein
MACFLIKPQHIVAMSDDPSQSRDDLGSRTLYYHVYRTGPVNIEDPCLGSVSSPHETDTFHMIVVRTAETNNSMSEAI